MLLSIRFTCRLQDSHIRVPLYLARRLQTYQCAWWRRLDTSLKSNQLRPSGARNIGARNACTEVRRLEDASILPSYRAGTQAQNLPLLRMRPSGKWVWLIFATPDSNRCASNMGGLGFFLCPPQTRIGRRRISLCRHLQHRLQGVEGKLSCVSGRRRQAPHCSCNVILPNRPSLLDRLSAG